MKIREWTASLAELDPLFRISMGLESADARARLIAIEQVRGTRYWVAEVNGEPVGFIGLFIDPEPETAELEPPQIIDVAVMPAHRRQGIAQALVQTAFEAVQEAGFSRVWLFTGSENARALAFYRELGFEVGGIVAGWSRSGEGRHYLYRDIPAVT